MKSIIKVAAVAALVAATAASLTGCATEAEENARQTNQQLGVYNKAQPVPLYDYSASRDVMIDIVTARATGQASTTFFFNLGVEDPIMECASRGIPLASTTQITAPDDVRTGGATVAQMEPDGIYVGDSQGTWVICVDDNGDDRPVYWEGNVQSQLGTAVWDSTIHRIVLR